MMGLVMKNVQREALRVWAGNRYYFQWEITKDEARQFFDYDVLRIERIASFYETNVGGKDADVSDSAQSLQDSARLRR
jgi:hypothetical protein